MERGLSVMFMLVIRGLCRGFESCWGHRVKSRDIVPVGVSRFSAFGCPRLPKTRHSQRREYCEGQATVRAKIVPRLRVFNTITGTWFWLQLSLVVSDTHLELLLKALEVPALSLARAYSQSPHFGAESRRGSMSRDIAFRRVWAVLASGFSTGSMW